MKTQTNNVSQNVQIELQAEELETVIAPGTAPNHNETFLAVELLAEELETVIAPGVGLGNHNETFLANPKDSFLTQPV